MDTSALSPSPDPARSLVPCLPGDKWRDGFADPIEPLKMLDDPDNSFRKGKVAYRCPF